jgi:hypothetical protein
MHILNNPRWRTNIYTSTGRSREVRDSRLLVDIMEHYVFNGENNNRRTTKCELQGDLNLIFPDTNCQLVYLYGFNYPIDGVQDLVK